MQSTFTWYFVTEKKQIKLNNNSDLEENDEGGNTGENDEEDSEKEIQKQADEEQESESKDDDNIEVSCKFYSHDETRY